ncbi:MAG: CatB-related O-acetyltransferase [Blautia sp.]
MILKYLKQLRCRLLLLGKHNIIFGKNSTFGRGTVLYAPNQMKIGENVYIGKYCSLEADIEIENDVLIGNNVGLIGKYDHDYSYVGKSIKDSPWIGDRDYQFKGKNLKIVIENDVWIGYGAILVSGVRIGHGAIVAAGSVVLKDVAPYSIVAGNPARDVSQRFNEEQIKEHERVLST